MPRGSKQAKTNNNKNNNVPVEQPTEIPPVPVEQPTEMPPVPVEPQVMNLLQQLLTRIDTIDQRILDLQQQVLCLFVLFTYIIAQKFTNAYIFLFTRRLKSRSICDSDRKISGFE